ICVKNSPPRKPPFQVPISGWYTNLGQPKFHEIRSSESRRGTHECVRHVSPRPWRQVCFLCADCKAKSPLESGLAARTGGGTEQRYLSFNTATPGSSMPARNSNEAPPPVEM